MKWLTIREYASEYEVFTDCLTELVKLHDRFKAKVNQTNKDRNYALFLLTEAAISTAHIAFDLYKKGYFLGVYQIARYILEIHSLVEYFLVLEDEKHAEIINWFDGKFIKTRFSMQNKDKI
ncbi:MAG: hypothetical protein A2158_05655 [Chloroflexi bacterium RBG_13_46_14]|nr:MAG: hypothetical protein A2158_05655 [Chloroflexi bacterium RBG_13_46_14]